MSFMYVCLFYGTAKKCNLFLEASDPGKLIYRRCILKAGIVLK